MVLALLPHLKDLCIVGNGLVITIFGITFNFQ